jgi:hypothetical protein
VLLPPALLSIAISSTSLSNSTPFSLLHQPRISVSAPQNHNHQSIARLRPSAESAMRLPTSLLHLCANQSGLLPALRPDHNQVILASQDRPAGFSALSNIRSIKTLFAKPYEVVPDTVSTPVRSSFRRLPNLLTRPYLTLSLAVPHKILDRKLNFSSMRTYIIG